MVEYVDNTNGEQKFSFLCSCQTRYVIPFEKVKNFSGFTCPICEEKIKLAEEIIGAPLVIVYGTQTIKKDYTRVRIELLSHDDESVN